MAMPTWKEVNQRVQQIAARRGEWAGMPMPVEGTSMTIHPSYPFADALSKTFMAKPSYRECHDPEVDDTAYLVNEWHSYRDGKVLMIWRDKTGFHFSHSSRQNSGPMIIETIGAARAWDFDAELRAQETLKRHLTEWAYQAYIMTGSFLESSKKSGVVYLFRRLRPTIALTANPGFSGKDGGMRILCTLCAHPVGYYNGSWAGALVPTDDVISHLLMMRSDEHYFWRVCNQHPAWAPESGL